MAARKSSKGVHKLEPMDIPKVFQCRKHPTVEVTLYVLGVPSCTKCGGVLPCVGYAKAQQPQLFAEVAQ